MSLVGLSEAVVMAVRRFRAPRENYSQLHEPHPEAVPNAIQENQRILNADAPRIAGHSLQEFRKLARAEALSAARDYLSSQGEPLPCATQGPLLVSGHQPELAHPGVWLKNFELHRLVKRVNGVGLNLIVDNDTLKSTSVRLPRYHAEIPERVQLQRVYFDETQGERPYEDYSIRAPEVWQSFPDRVSDITSNWGNQPILSDVWPQCSELPIGELFSRMRRKQEREWGCLNWELPISRLARTESFKLFTRLIACDPHFRQIYNEAVQAYRRAHDLKSPRHPVPDLAGNDQSWEAAYWLRTRNGRRERLFIQAGTWEESLEIRPRALTLTLFARVALSDYFLHGIGGGKYDEVTDQIIETFFKIPVPSYSVISGTLHLPLKGFPGSASELHGLERRYRELIWNPQLYLSENSDVNPLLDQRQRLLDSTPSTAAQRRSKFRELREITVLLRSHVQPLITECREDLARVRRELAANTILKRRDYPWVLYPKSELRKFLVESD
jgi:hypothetical protein